VPIKIIHIGIGIRGSHWVQFVHDHPDTVSVSLVDSDENALEKAKAGLATNCQCSTDLDRALETTDADAAIIASPSAFHAEHAHRALKAGLAVMVEKPFASSVEQASQVIQEAESIGKPIMVAENYRFWPAERTIRNLIRDGFLGQVDNVTVVDRRNMPSHTEGPWLAKIDFPQLSEIAIHHFDSLRSLLDRRPTSITTRVWNPPWSDYQHGACTEAIIQMEGVNVQYLGTLTSHRFSFALWIEAEQGVLWSNRKYVLWRARGKRFFRPVKLAKVPPGDAARYPKGGTTSLLNSLRDAVLHGQTPETSGYDNIWTLAMVEAAKRSHHENRTVSIDEVTAN
jgi:predicted dehydrogenase